MALFACVDQANTILKYIEQGTQPPDPVGKGWKWLPVVDTNPAITDAATQVKEGPVITVNPNTNVTRVWTVRSKTAPELDAEKQANVDGIDRVLLEIAFNHENRIRTLAGQGAVTRAQFKAAIKALL
ncbi:MAG TPA: hypothetical protein PLF26_13070 [Blastocatellia bacterium]|nr:hypothetical protein [Blastocatellia bacterium]